MYSVSKLKEWEGMDGVGCHGEIRDSKGKPVAVFRDDGTGGGLFVDPFYDVNTQTYQTPAYDEFKGWAADHPVLPEIAKMWGFEPNGNGLDLVVEFLIVESRITKEKKKGYLCYQLPGQPLTFMGAKTGRKKTKYDEPTLKWLMSVEPTAICRNTEDPDWIKE